MTEQPNIRRDFGENYTCIPSDILRDDRVSLKAKGLYATIMGLPRDWKLSVKGLVKILKEGRDGIYSAIKELEEYGYVTRTQERDGKGVMGSMIYTLHSHPVGKEKVDDTPEVFEKIKETPPEEPAKAEYHQKSLEERAEEFRNSLQKYSDKYSQAMLDAFFDYWTEPNRSKTKMRFEEGDVWGMSQRLKRWQSNGINYERNNTANRTELRQKDREQRNATTCKGVAKILSECSPPPLTF